MATPLALVWDLIGRDSASVTFDKVGASAVANAKRIDSMTVATERAGGAAAGQTSKFGAMYKGLAALATVDVAAHLVHMAADFEYQMGRMVTAAGESQKNLATVSSGVLNLMGATGTGAKDLEKALYLIESAGFHGAAGLNVLKVAAQGAKIENANVGDVAQAVSSMMVDYHVKASDAASVMNTLIAATAHGMTTTEDMALAVSKVGAAGALAKVPLSDLTAAIATMTMHGTDAAVAGTYLRQVIGQLEGGSAKARLVMAGLGLDANQVGQTLSSGPGGLAKAIGMLDDAIQSHLTPSGLVAIETFKKSKGSLSDFQKVLGDIPPSLVTTFSALANMTGGVKSLQGFLQLGGENLKTFKANTDAVNEAVRKGGKSVEGWAATQKQLSVQLDMLRYGAEALGIRIGEALIPIVQKAIDAFKNIWNVIKPLAHDIGTIVVDAWNGLSTAVTAVGRALSAGIIGTALHGLYNVLNSNRSIVFDLAKGVLGLWLAFKGVAIATAALKALEGALVAARVRMIALADSFTLVAAGMKAVTWGQFATGIAAVGFAIYAAGKAMDNWLNSDDPNRKIGTWTDNVNSFRDALQQSNGALTEAITLDIKKKLQDSGLAEKAAAAGISLDDLSTAVSGNNNQFNALIKTWESSGHPAARTEYALAMLHTQFGIGAGLANDLNDATSKTTKVLYGSANAAEHAATGTAKVAAATQAATDASKAFADNVTALGKNATDTGTAFLTAATAFGKLTDPTAADRATLIGATLKAANGDALSFAASMAGAFGANSSLVTAFQSDADKIAGIKKQIGDLNTQLSKLGKDPHHQRSGILSQIADLDKQLADAYKTSEKAAIQLSTGAIDFKKAGAPALISGLQSIQDAAVKAAGALYQHEVHTRGGAKAAADAYDLYKTQTSAALIAEAKQLGITSDQAKRLADRYFGMPGKVKTLIEQEGANPVLTVLTDIDKMLRFLATGKWNIPVKVTVQDEQLKSLEKNLGLIANTTARGAQNKLISLVGANAAGTNDWRGGPTWVGERGPEIVNLPKHTQIIPHSQASSMSGGSHGVTIQKQELHVHYPEPGNVNEALPNLMRMAALSLDRR